MPQKLLDRHQVRPCVEEVRGEAVPQRVRAQPHTWGRIIEEASHNGLDRPSRESFPRWIEEEGLTVRRHRRRLELEAARQVPADGPPRRPGDGYESLLVSFTQHFGLLSLQIEVREVQTVKFRQPETTPVQELEDDQVPRPSKGILRRARFGP